MYEQGLISAPPHDDDHRPTPLDNRTVSEHEDNWDRLVEGHDSRSYEDHLNLFRSQRHEPYYEDDVLRDVASDTLSSRNKRKAAKQVLSELQFDRNMAIHKSYNDIADHIAKTGKQMMFKDGTSGTAAEAPDGTGRLIAMDSKRIPKLKF